MIEIEGYRAFRGSMRVCPRTGSIAPFELVGDFLYKPDTGCWYHKGHSYTESTCVVGRDDTGEDEDKNVQGKSNYN